MAFLPTLDQARRIVAGNAAFTTSSFETDGFRVHNFGYLLPGYMDFEDPVPGSGLQAHELRGLTFVEAADGSWTRHLMLRLRRRSGRQRGPEGVHRGQARRPAAGPLHAGPEGPVRGGDSGPGQEARGRAGEAGGRLRPPDRAPQGRAVGRGRPGASLLRPRLRHVAPRARAAVDLAGRCRSARRRDAGRAVRRAEGFGIED